MRLSDILLPRYPIIGSRYSRMNQVKFLKVVFYKFYLVYPWISWPNYNWRLSWKHTIFLWNWIFVFDRLATFLFYPFLFSLLSLNGGVKRDVFMDLLQIFGIEILLVKATHGTYLTENAWLQGCGCPEHAIVTSQRQISEDLIYRELFTI